MVSQWAYASHSVDALDVDHNHNAECLLCLYESSCDPTPSDSIPVHIIAAADPHCANAYRLGSGLRNSYVIRAPPVAYLQAL